MKSFKLDREKFDKLVHYIVWKCPDEAELGTVEIHKILWKLDTSFFLQHRRPITGTRYTRREWGPAADELPAAQDRLSRAGKIKVRRGKGFAFGHPKDAYEALKGPAAGFLTREEHQTVDDWINEICLRHTAQTTGDEMHGYAWEIIPQGEDMPIEAVLMERGREPKGAEREWAVKQARKRGLV